MYYSIKIDEKNNIVGTLASAEVFKNYISIKKELYEEIHLPSRAILNNKGNIVAIENVENTQEMERIEKFKNIQMQIKQYKNKLSNTDYQAIKYAEGQLTEDEYAPIKKQRQLWRDEINKLENIAEEV